MTIASLRAALSILTWQANVLAVPALVALLVLSGKRASLRHAATFVAVLGTAAGTVYLIAGFANRGFMGPNAFWSWFSRYSETGNLRLWVCGIETDSGIRFRRYGF